MLIILIIVCIICVILLAFLLRMHINLSIIDQNLSAMFEFIQEIYNAFDIVIYDKYNTSIKCIDQKLKEIKKEVDKKSSQNEDFLNK